MCDCEGGDLAFWVPLEDKDDCGPSLLLFFSSYHPGSTWILGLPYSPGEVLHGEGWEDACWLSVRVHTHVQACECLHAHMSVCTQQEGVGRRPHGSVPTVRAACDSIPLPLGDEMLFGSLPTLGPSKWLLFPVVETLATLAHGGDACGVQVPA